MPWPAESLGWLKQIPLRPRQIQWLFGILLAIVFLVAAGQHYSKARKLSRLGTHTKTAFLRWRVQIIGDETPGRGQMPGFKKGDDVYRLFNYPNPPIMAILLWPLAELPATFGSLLLFGLKVLMAAGTIVWSLRLLTGPGVSRPIWVPLATVACALHPILGDLSHGNINIVIIFFVMGSLELHRRGLSLAAGLLMALAIACKVTPALFVPFYGWKMLVELRQGNREGRRGWARLSQALLPRWFAGCALGLALWLWLIPSLVMQQTGIADRGFEHNEKLLRSWFDVMVKPFVLEGKITSEHANQSIPGVVTRLLTHAPSVVGYDDEDRPYGAEYDNFVDIGPEGARWVVRGCQALWVLAVIGLCGSPQRQGLRVGAEAALVILGMLLFSERTWKHHAVGLALPFGVAFTWLASGPRWSRPGRCALAVSLALVWLPSIIGGEFQDEALTYGTHTAAFVFLTLMMVSVLWQPTRSD